MSATLISLWGMLHVTMILELKLSVAVEQTTKIVLVRLHEFLLMMALGA
jgi:hypothetical protein